MEISALTIFPCTCPRQNPERPGTAGIFPASSRPLPSPVEGEIITGQKIHKCWEVEAATAAASCLNSRPRRLIGHPHRAAKFRIIRALLSIVKHSGAECANSGNLGEIGIEQNGGRQGSGGVVGAAVDRPQRSMLPPRLGVTSFWCAPIMV